MAPWMGLICLVEHVNHLDDEPVLYRHSLSLLLLAGAVDVEHSYRSPCSSDISIMRTYL
jgi:hypothetical protein